MLDAKKKDTAGPAGYPGHLMVQLLGTRTKWKASYYIYIYITGTVYYDFGEVSLGFLILRVLSSTDSCKSFLG